MYLRCSYNAESYGEGIYGTGTQGGAIPSCANKGILNDLARDEWGFDGYITSDCGAVDNVQNDHHYTSNASETVTAVLSAGMEQTVAGSWHRRASDHFSMTPRLPSSQTKPWTPKFPKWRLRRLGSDKQRWVWGLEVATAAGRLPSVN